MNDATRLARRPNGYTLVEVIVVMLVVGILAGISYPQYFQHVETGRMQEAIETVSSLSAAQGRYYAKYNSYCNNFTTPCSGFDLTTPPLRYFTAAAPTAGGAGIATSWQITLTRNNAPYYGSYTVTYDVEPGVAPALTCSPTPLCTPLMPTYLSAN